MPLRRRSQCDLCAGDGSHEEADAAVTLRDGTTVELHAETEDPTREVRIHLRVPPPAPSPRRVSFEEAYRTAWQGFAISAAIGGGLGVLFAGAMADDGWRAPETWRAGFAAGAAFTGPLGPGFALGTRDDGADHAGLAALLASVFARWFGAGAAAVGPIAESGDALAGCLAAIAASAVIGPLWSAVVFQAFPGKSQPRLVIGPSGLAGTF